MMKLGPIDLPGVVYVTRHLRDADVRELESTRYGTLDRDALAIEIVQVWAQVGHAWLVYGHDGRPAAIFGATQPWPGMWSAYMLATPDFPSVALPLTKYVKNVFIPYLRKRGHRIEARSIDGHAAAHRWLGVLGATVEARHKAYGRNGEDFIVFVLAMNPDAAIVDNSD